MADTDSDDERKPSLKVSPPENDTTVTSHYLTSHLAPHISATRHHLAGAPEEPPAPPPYYAPSFHPPTGHWTSAEKALFFRALTAHSRLRPDLIAASIGTTKSTADVAVYLALLRQAARDNPPNPNGGGGGGGGARDQHPAAHEVSAALVALEDKHAARLSAAEPALARETREATRREAERAGGEWAREDVLGGLDGDALVVLDRVLRLDEERGGSPEPGTPTLDVRAGESSSPPRSPHDSGDDGKDVDDAGTDLSPASRRRIAKRLYMRRMRAKAAGGVAQLDPARLKPGRKASAASNKAKQHHLEETGGEQKQKQQHTPGETRPYKIQRELEQLGIGADYLRENGLGLFHLGALGRLMRLYPRLDAERPEGVAESIAAGTIQALHALVVQFTRDLVRRAIALRELDFALRAHTKVWGLGPRHVRPPHIRRALELRGGAWMSKRAHFGALLERFSEGEASPEEEHGDDDDDDDDVPLAVRALKRKEKGKAVVRDVEEEDEGEGSGGEQQHEQHAGSSGDAQAHEAAAAQRWSSTHRAMYTPFVYAPDIIAPSHPFGVYAPGTTPDPLGLLQTTSLHRAAEEDGYETDEEEDDLMPSETDDEALAVELAAEAQLDAADARAAAAYEAAVWRELRECQDSAGAGARLRRRTKRPALAEAVVVVDDAHHAVHLRKRRKDALGGWAAPADMLKSPDGVRVKSAAVIEDSDSDEEYLG
ncbi:hypothetical protein BJV78DRAFT_1356255 [Lactifluus subvellereus]|nr:hypothetical protein BJV78DRAFT_1356255 [Lactifluus subvellereus]